MKKLLQLLTIWALAPICLIGQPSQATGKAYSHLAQFSVYDYTTKAPIQKAVVVNPAGEELGYTDYTGSLALNVPPNTSEFYTIKAEGFNPMNIRLTQADKKKGEYEVFLPASEIGYSRTNSELMADASNDMVKVYVKQDPATYQKKGSQGGEIIFSVQVGATAKPVNEKEVKAQWGQVGQVYVHQENGMYKVRIGPYSSQQEAKQALLQVKSLGRNDAFIVVMQHSEFDPPMITNAPEPREQIEVQAVSSNDLQEGDYKVRVASYTHPGAFNPEGIDQLGRLESYRKGEWTIMMIGGFRTIDEARKARNIVQSKGFSDASIVMDKDGIIETIEEK